MRIGIDMMALQGWDRHRGIGRYGSSLLDHMVALDPSVEYILYAHDGLPADLIPAAPNARRRDLRPDQARGERASGQVIERIAGENPDGLDILLVLGPFDQTAGYDPPPRPPRGPKVAAVVYDLIPFLFQEHYLGDPGHADRFYRKLGRVRQYNTLLAISDATRLDCERLLGLPPGRVINISGACDPGLFRPAPAGPISAEAREALAAAGVEPPFVFCLGGMDRRKNWKGLVDAFALLPESLRGTHRLVMACQLTDEYRDLVRDHAAERGVADRLVLTGGIADETLRVLYQRCAAFCFPSLYEGFGLPILEAMRCGAAVVAGDNSSQVEVAGDAALLAVADDPSDVAAKLARVLAEPGLADSLRARGLEQAARFSWERTATLALEALKRTAAAGPRRRLRADPGHDARPRVAVFSPLPPKSSGISDYTTRLVGELGRRYAIDFYHDSGYVPEPALASAAFGSFDHRLFDRNAPLIGYHAVLYQMGNSHYHRFVYEMMLRRPGVVTLHDFGLAGFQWWYAHQPGVEPGHFAREVARFDPARATSILPLLDSWDAEPGNMQEACSRRGVYLNRAIFEAGQKVIVHSEWCHDRVGELYPEHLEKTTVIPHGAEPIEPSAGRRAATRERFGLPADALLFGSFGILHPNKMNVAALEAFAPLARERPDILFIFVGQDLGFGEARRRALELGLVDRVRFLGRQPAEAFGDLVGCVDVGVALRLPPTNGETSGALLDLLRRGVPSIITDVAAFSDYPATVARKVRWEADGPGALAAAMRGLASDPAAREALGRSALAHVREHHDWARAASLYARVIEECHASRPRPGSSARRRGIGAA